MKFTTKPLKRSDLKTANTLRDACIGCKDCKGTCWTMLELLSVPDAISQIGAQ